LAERAIVVGASSGVGRALAAELSRRGFDLVLAARGERDLEAVAADLRLRWGNAVAVEPIDLAAPDFDARSFCERCLARLGGLDAVLVTAGLIDPRDVGLTEPELAARLVRVNYSGVLQLVAELGRYLEQQDRGTPVTFSSIAAAAPRRKNAVYSSAKAALEVYCRALRHHFRDRKVVVQTYALGYVDSAMTFGQELRFPIASPEKVAAHVVRNLGRDCGRVYLPRFWALVVLVLRHLPWSLYKRLDF
jgi:short-subunit dehydrogenase